LFASAQFRATDRANVFHCFLRFFCYPLEIGGQSYRNSPFIDMKKGKMPVNQEGSQKENNKA
jgi:hypothetical protein